MKRSAMAAGLLTLLLSGAAHSQTLQSVAILGGNETLILRPNTVNNDCTSAERPDVRLIGKAVNGAVRMEPIAVTLNRPATNPGSKCNGKQVDGIGVYYKANDGFVGVERLVFQADYRNGTVGEMVVLVDVR